MIRAGQSRAWRLGLATDQQVGRLFTLSDLGMTQELVAAKAGMGRKTARKYLRSGKLPSETTRPRTWRTRPDRFEEVWEEVREQLELNPGLQAKPPPARGLGSRSAARGVDQSISGSGFLGEFSLTSPTLVVYTTQKTGASP